MAIFATERDAGPSPIRSPWRIAVPAMRVSRTAAVNAVGANLSREELTTLFKAELREWPEGWPRR